MISIIYFGAKCPIHTVTIILPFLLILSFLFFPFSLLMHQSQITRFSPIEMCRWG